MEGYPFPNGVIGGLISTVKSSLNLMGKKLGSYQKPTHRNEGNKPHPAPKKILNRVEPTDSNSC